MYNQVKEKFKINEELIKCIIQENPLYQDLFDDYEGLCMDVEVYKSGLKVYHDYRALIKELEEEILRIVEKYELTKW